MLNAEWMVAQVLTHFGIPMHLQTVRILRYLFWLLFWSNPQNPPTRNQ